MKRLGWILTGLLAAAVGIQFVPVTRDNPPVTSELRAPPAVLRILRRSCYDCHSNETRWPWYSRVAPMSWGVADHVHEGRRDLNFSTWPVLDFELQDLAFRDIREQVSEGHMPLRSYLWVHRDARLSDADRKVLLKWTGDEGS